MFFKSLITPEPRIGKFQNWAEMKVNYPTDNKNTQMDFSDNFHNIKNFVQVDHIEKIMKNRLIFSSCRFQKTPVIGNFLKSSKINAYKCQITVLKFQTNRTTTRFRV
jgi:hypothetical protein